MQEQQPEETEVLSGHGGGTSDRASLGTLWRRRSARGRTVIAATTVAVLALGGTVAYAAASGGPSDGPSVSPSSTVSHGPGERGGHGGPWLRFGGDAVHGETTVKDPDSGEWVVRVWQRGTVEATDGDRVTVKSEDGASWTWTVGPDTPVRVDGASGTGAEALTKGDTVYVAGSRSGDTYTADRVFSGERGDRTEPGEPGERGGHGPDGPHGGFPGHGPWGRDDDRSPGPTGGGSAT